MSTELATVEPNTDASSVERVIATGDLAKLTPAERVNYYQATCRSLGLNPLTQPFQYITLNGKLTLYARRDCTDQLRKLHGVSIVGLEEKQVGDIFVIKAHARDQKGREDCSTGAVSLKGLAGDALANALMKAETKAKRRVTLSVCGLGFLDETEVETVADARPYREPEPAALPSPPAKTAAFWPWCLKVAPKLGISEWQLLNHFVKVVLEEGLETAKEWKSNKQKIDGLDALWQGSTEWVEWFRDQAKTYRRQLKSQASASDVGGGQLMDPADVALCASMAAFYRSRGYQPLPSRTDAKRPMVRFREWWETAAPADLFDRHPTSNVQIMTGRHWRLLVIDLDGPEARERWGALGSTPRTWVTHSGGGGQHLWFRLPADYPQPLPKCFLWQGDGKHQAIERLCDLSLMMAPPSIHPTTGQRYRFLSPGQSPQRLPLPADCPAWVLRLAPSCRKSQSPARCRPLFSDGRQPHHPGATREPTCWPRSPTNSPWPAPGACASPGARALRLGTVPRYRPG